MKENGTRKDVCKTEGRSERGTLAVIPDAIIAECSAITHQTDPLTTACQAVVRAQFQRPSANLARVRRRLELSARAVNHRHLIGRGSGSGLLYPDVSAGAHSVVDMGITL